MGEVIEMKFLIVILFAVIGLLAGEVYVQYKQKKKWKASAMGNAHARHAMYKDLREQGNLINKNAAMNIKRLEAENQDLRDALQRQRNLNRSMMRKMDRRQNNDAGD